MSVHNYTIDDSYWGTPSLLLTPGWNMLRVNGSDQYINATQVDTMTPLLSNFWNSSVSWTTDVNASTTIVFIGTDIWAYGMSGPNCGAYTATLDNATLGTFNSQASATNYHDLLVSAHGMSDTEHKLTLTNTGDGTWLAFDVAIISSTVAFENATEQAQAAAEASASASAVAAAEYSASIAAVESASAVAAAEAVGFTWSAAQLASLKEVYVFHWNPAAYFVVSFASMIVLCLLTMVLTMLIRACRSRVKIGSLRGDNGYKEGESYIMDSERRTRPTTRVLEALRGRKISTPVPMSAEGSEFTSTSGKGDDIKLW